MNESLKKYITRILESINSLSDRRKVLLNRAVLFIIDKFEKEEVVNLTFICTHNSRRSHFGQVWCQVAADHFGLSGIHTFSGGTESTGCNIRTIEAMRRTGLSITDSTGGANPVYFLELTSSQSPLRLYSKTYDAEENPHSGYAAMMCCSDVDEECPVIHGAEARIPLHYTDPKVSDETANEIFVYDERCAEIATEMFYLLSSVKLGMKR